MGNRGIQDNTNVKSVENENSARNENTLKLHQKKICQLEIEVGTMME
jgi:hypothetical protein